MGVLRDKHFSCYQGQFGLLDRAMLCTGGFLFVGRLAFECKAVCPAVRKAIVDAVRSHVLMCFSTITEGCSNCQIGQYSVLVYFLSRTPICMLRIPLGDRSWAPLHER